MNIERAAINNILITARETLTPSNWLCGFANVDNGTVVYCVTQNDGLATGPLLLPVEETATPTAVDGEVTLAEGDWILTIHEQTSTTNLNPATAGLRLVWTEQIRVQ